MALGGESEMTSSLNNPGKPERQCAKLLIELFDLIAAGHGDEESADEIRGRMDFFWSRMSPEQCELARGLSRDLDTMIEGGPKAVQLSPEQAERRAQSFRDASAARNAGRPQIALELLRGGIPANLPPSGALFLQARLWDAAGFPDVAIRFFEEAQKSDPTIAPLTLSVLEREGRFVEAAALAEELFSKRPDDPIAVYVSAGFFLDSVRHQTPEEARPTLERIREPLRRALDKAGKDNSYEAEMPGLFVGLGMTLGLCLEWLNNRQAAVQIYDLLLQRYPNESGVLTTRGLALLNTDDATALRDFEKAIRLNAQSPWPFIAVSRHLLLSGNHWDAVKLCNIGLEKEVGAGDAEKALLYEGLAIGYAMGGQSITWVLENFDRALDLDPNNDRIRANREKAVSGELAQRKTPPSSIPGRLIKQARTKLLNGVTRSNVESASLQLASS
jgi:tetratricopeptide (TPR) repeat protein